MSRGGRKGKGGGRGERYLERALAVVAPEAGTVVDAPVGGELLDGVHLPAARRALLRGAAPRPRHPLAAVAALLLRPARRWRGEGSGGRGRRRGKRKEATATGGGVDDWRRWNGRSRAAQAHSTAQEGGEAWENNGSADGGRVGAV